MQRETSFVIFFTDLNYLLVVQNHFDPAPFRTLSLYWELDEGADFSRQQFLWVKKAEDTLCRFRKFCKARVHAS
jgi:hypothetical protein